jgi:hypothetical protein
MQPPHGVSLKGAKLNKDDQLQLAAAARDELETMHKGFMSSIAGLKEPKVNGAELGVADSELYCVCLGVTLRAPHRLIVRDGAFDGIEYTFTTEHRGESLPIWSMYLMPGDGLYEDSAKSSRICDASNQYLASRIAPRLASALIGSPVFVPRA